MRHKPQTHSPDYAGMAWGIATVVLLLAYRRGLGRAIHNIFSNLHAG